MLKKKENYYITLDSKISSNIIYFYSIIEEYLKHFNEIEGKDKNIIYYGLYILHHIFNFLLFYTKNIYLTLTYTKNGYIYYIEFIEQIKKKNNLFLKLKKEDAALFVYKKTIFDINKTFYQCYSSKEKEKINYIYNFTNYIIMLFINKINKNKTFKIQDVININFNENKTIKKNNEKILNLIKNNNSFN